ncbi:hypothetical protein DEO72_LG5g2177 [Vigna unguiculata]|uniref:Uncharacterized protein n=1 Tax=Vigna unguiculata TaxID=3917 RepID=A0A4D6M0H2_VIGUN|nr:hypothetical protein DEO72_LG5g2177 [Vigna unguiculata]
MDQGWQCNCYQASREKKLGLSSETEVETTLQWRPVLSSWKLNSLVEMWLQAKE